jgi:hypothetical protein
MTKKLFISLALCLALFGIVNPILAQTDEKSGEDTLAQLQREGWKIVKDGVLQRELTPGAVESFVFGAPGFTWKIQDLQRQLRKLQAELRAHPTPELRKAIANHRKAIANSQRALELARASEDSGEEIDLSKVSCAINFSYDATAGPQTSVQGVWANANATFSANCGFTGQVYAYAFAKAWYNGAETTQTVTDGPRSGANVSATAYASRNGGTPCESRSFGEMVSYGLNPSSWSKEVANYSCPPVANPPTVTVTSDHATVIDLYEYDCVYITWTTNINPGTPPYSTVMYRNNVSQGVRTTYSQTICNLQTTTTQTITIRSDVTDSAGQSGSGSHTTTIRHHYYNEPVDPCYSTAPSSDGKAAPLPPPCN